MEKVQPKNSRTEHFEFWLEWDVWERPVENIQQKNNGIESVKFSILIGLGCLGGAGRKDSTKKNKIGIIMFNVDLVEKIQPY